MHKSLTTGNFQRYFLPGGFFCQEILEDRHGGDVVRFEYRLSLSARIYKEGLMERAVILCKLNKSPSESSTSVGIHRKKVCIP